MDIADEAMKRFPPSMPVEYPDGELSHYRDDEYGYDDLQRRAFIAGAEWVLAETHRAAENADADQTLAELAERLARPNGLEGVL